MTDDHAAALVAHLDARLGAMHEDLVEIKTQVTKTNGRVTELEVASRIDTALAAERATKLARESETRADRLHAQTLATERRGQRRQWLVNASIGAAGVGATIAALLVK